MHSYVSFSKNARTPLSKSIPEIVTRNPPLISGPLSGPLLGAMPEIVSGVLKEKPPINSAYSLFGFVTLTFVSPAECAGEVTLISLSSTMVMFVPPVPQKDTAIALPANAPSEVVG